MQTDTITHKIDASNKFYALYVELRAVTESYGGGLAALAQKVSISKPTLWRWANLQNKKAPNPYHVLSLMKFYQKRNLCRHSPLCWWRNRTVFA